MKRKKTLLLFLLYVTLGGIAGGTISVVLMMGENSLAAGWNSVVQFISKNIVWVIGLTDLLIAGSGALIVLLAVKRHRGLAGNPEQVDEKVDPLVDWGMSLNTCGLVFLFLFYGIFLAEERGNLKAQVLPVALLFIGGAVIALIMEVFSIRFIQKIHPGKAGDPLSLKFSKEWLMSCDELEKRILYISAYKTLLGMKILIIVLFGALMLLNIAFPIGLAGYVVLAVIWLFFKYQYNGQQPPPDKKRGFGLTGKELVR